ncbi:TOBE domain-containing protein [Nocardioides daejeonensis]|uniref:TOBE domain-containing protein n=1 Tax=Nocardioides daejeonensis TaxID=1046556 RepID=UPI000D746AA7|nr:TOBE domain-containing protein [Nocardioides daejeonensis]
MPKLRIKDAAAHLGVSDDTVRRWVERGLLSSETDDAGRQVVDGLDVALVARDHAVAPEIPHDARSSARNRLVGLVTQIVSDRVMSQVEIQCGPFRLVSLMSTEAVRELGLEPGSVAVASIKSTNVVVEVEGANHS